MTITEEAARSVRGAWGLLRRDPAAPAAFNATPEGFWRSFFAAVVLFPLQMAYYAYASEDGADQVAGGTRWSIDIIFYVMAWTAWPLAAFYLTRLFQCGDRFLGYIVAYNWSQLLSAPFLIGINLLARAWFPAEDADTIYLTVLAGVLLYEYTIARQMLAIPRHRAIALEMSAFACVVVLRAAADFALALCAPAVPG
jgi:hypothetical protein